MPYNQQPTVSADAETRRYFLTHRVAPVLAAAAGIISLASCGETSHNQNPRPWESLSAAEKTAYLNTRFQQIAQSSAAKINTYAHGHPQESFIPDGTKNQEPGVPYNEASLIPARSTIPGTTGGQYELQVVANTFSQDGNPELSSVIVIEARVLAQVGEMGNGVPDMRVNHHTRIARAENGWSIHLQEPSAQNSLITSSVDLYTGQPESLSPGFVNAIEARFNTVFADATQQPEPVPVGNLPAPMK